MTRTHDMGVVADDMLRLTRLMDRLRPHVFGDDECTRLMLLAPLRRQGPMRTGALAEAVYSDASTVSRQVAELVREGLVERRADPADGRATVLVLTDKAERTVDEAMAHRDTYLTALLTDWSAGDLKELARLLGRLTDTLQGHKHALACGGHLHH